MSHGLSAIPLESLFTLEIDSRTRGHSSGYSPVCNRSSACGADPFSVRAKCYRSMRKNSAPHRVQLDLNDMAEVKSWSCSCAAGAALCHHAVGLLYQLQNFQRRGLKAVPVIESKTSAPQTA